MNISTATKVRITLAMLFVSLCVQGQTNLKVMFYNLSSFPSALPENREVVLKDILSTAQPDIFLVSELETQAGADLILNTSLKDIGKAYAMADFYPNQSLNTLVYFNNDYFVLHKQKVIPTVYRDINHYTFILKTDDYLNNPQYLEVFTSHFRYSTGSKNEQTRLKMANEFVKVIEDLDADSYVLFGGDFNFYSTNEPAYQKLLDVNNNIIFKDILNLNNDELKWHNNATLRHLHTQSTRVSNVEFGNYGGKGGLNERYDLFFVSKNMLEDGSINYVDNTYVAYGNNSNCYNNSVNSEDCSGSFSQEIRDNLYQMSDHLPIVLELETKSAILNVEKPSAEVLLKFPKGTTVNEILKIHFNDALLNKQLKMYNTIGQEVLLKTITSSQLDINMSSLHSGIYYIKIEDYSEAIAIIKL